MNPLTRDQKLQLLRDAREAAEIVLQDSQQHTEVLDDEDDQVIAEIARDIELATYRVANLTS